MSEQHTLASIPETLFEPASLLSLDYDTFSHIASYLPSADAFRLALTTKALHAAATRQALSSVTITIPDRLGIFCRYMLTDVHGRLYWLRELKILCQTFWSHYILNASQAAQDLVQLFQHVQDLRSLTLWSSDVWIRMHPRIRDALSAIRTLRTLELGGVGISTTDLLKALESAPHTLVLSTISVTPAPTSSYLHPNNMKKLLSVRDLAVDVLRNADMNGFSRVFPNIERLRLDERARISPVRSRRRPVEKLWDMDWPNLHYICAYPPIFELWRNISPVHHVELCSEMFMNPFDEACGRSTLMQLSLDIPLPSPSQSIITGVQLTSPVALTINGIDHQLPQLWYELMSDMPRLRYLNLELYRLSAHGNLHDGLERSMNNMASAFSGLNLLCLEIQVGPSLTTQSNNANIDYFPAYYTPDLQQREDEVRRTLLHFPASAARFPSLRYVALNLGPEYSRLGRETIPRRLPGHARREAYWWRFTGGGAGAPRTAGLMKESAARLVRAHLQSPEYEYEKEFDESLMLHSSLLDFDTDGL